MSGGSGGEYIPVRREENLSCSDLVISTSLNSPNPDVLVHLKVGDYLTIVRDGESVIAKHKNKIAGSITHLLYVDLLNCLKRGNKYTGIVQKISSGNCEVKILHNSKL